MKKEKGNGLLVLILFALVILLGWDNLPERARQQIVSLWQDRPLLDGTPQYNIQPAAIPTDFAQMVTPVFLIPPPTPTGIVATLPPPTIAPSPTPIPLPQRSITVYLDSDLDYEIDPGEAVRQLPIEVVGAGTVLTDDDGRATFDDPNPGGTITFSIAYVGRNDVLDTRQDVVVRLVPLP